MFILKIEASAHGGNIPAVFTSEGDNISPALAWADEPEGTQSFALIMDNPDALAGNWNHWLLWDIPCGVQSVPQHYRAAPPVHAATNDFGKAGYGGPSPPKRDGPHRYFFMRLIHGI